MQTSEASLSTRLSVWWSSVPLVTRLTLAVCTGVFGVLSLTGYRYSAVCLAAAPVLHGQVYRLVTSALVHAGLLHLAMNMLALTSLGPPLERQLGSLLLAWLMALLCLLGGAVYTLAAAAAAHLPLPHTIPALDFGSQCAVGFSGVLFGLIVVETHQLAAASRSLVGFVNVPARLYPWALLLFWQLLVPNASLLGHLSGLLVGQLYCMRLLAWAIPSSATLQAIERSAACSLCMRSSGFIAHTAATQGDAVLPVTHPSVAGYQAMASPARSSLLRPFPYLPFPSSSQRLANLFGSSAVEAAPPSQLPGEAPGDAKAAAAAAAEARASARSDGRAAGQQGAGSSGATSTS